MNTNLREWVCEVKEMFPVIHKAYLTSDNNKPRWLLLVVLFLLGVKLVFILSGNFGDFNKYILTDFHLVLVCPDATKNMPT